MSSWTDGHQPQRMQLLMATPSVGRDESRAIVAGQREQQQQQQSQYASDAKRRREQELQQQNQQPQM